MRAEPGDGWCPDRPPEGGSPLWVQGGEPEALGVGPEIEWYGPADRGARSANQAWCETVGPPVVNPSPHASLLRPDPGAADTDVSPGAPSDEVAVPEARTGAQAATVSIVAWNTWLGGADLKAFLAEELLVKCEPDGPRAFPGFTHFVLLLQEVHRRSTLVPQVHPNAPVPWYSRPSARPEGEPDITDIARACGLSLAYVPSARNGWESEDGIGEDKGNAIVSSLPLLRVAAIELPFEAGRKVAVSATVDLDPAFPLGAGSGPSPLTLEAVSVHLDVASTLVRTILTGNQTRVRQVRGLLEALEASGRLESTIVAGGDFNTASSRDASLKVMRLHLPESPPLAREGTRGPFAADHLFFSSGPGGHARYLDGSYRTLEHLYGSDHQARQIELLLTAEDDAS